MRALLILPLALTACSPGVSPAPPSFGSDPVIEVKADGPPVIKPAKAVGWSAGAQPAAAEGLVVTRYAEGLAHPRWLERLPNGDILVAEASATPGKVRSIEDFVANRMMDRAGAFSEGSNRITLLRDSNGDGVVDETHRFAEGLNKPMGMALIGGFLYVGAADALLRFPYVDGQTTAGPAEKVLTLPSSPDSRGHWTRTLLPHPDGQRLFIAVGSASNIAERGLAAEEGRAAIWEVDLQSGSHRIYASGLRNPVGLGLEPGTGRLWTTVNERDMLGDNAAPDYLTSVDDGDFFGWPWSYWGQSVDPRVEPANPEMVAKARTPDYALGAHTASLGLAFGAGSALPESWRNGAFVAQHGSWNRSTPSGYKVIFVPWADGKPAGEPRDVLTGFLNAKGEAQGRPTGVAFDRTGALLVTDDVGDIVWRVAPAG